jgi:hypothetical protein
MKLIRLTSSGNIYPYTVEQFKKDNPSFSFSDDLEGVDLSLFDVARVIELPYPEYDRYNQVPDPLPPELINGEWVVDWTIRDLLPEERPPNYPAFNLFMLTDPANMAYKVALNQINPDLCYAVTLTYNNIVDRGTSDFIAIFPLFCQYAQVSQEDRNSWANKAQEFNLPADFVDAIRG